jgi:hypothetical protein
VRSGEECLLSVGRGHSLDEGGSLGGSLDLGKAFRRRTSWATGWW